MSIMGSIYTNPSELGSDYWKERAETYLHDQELYRKECDTLRTKLDIAVDKITVTLIHLKRFDNVSDYHYCIDLAKITLDNALAEIEKGAIEMSE